MAVCFLFSDKLIQYFFSGCSFAPCGHAAAAGAAPYLFCCWIFGQHPRCCGIDIFTCFPIFTVRETISLSSLSHQSCQITGVLLLDQFPVKLSPGAYVMFCPSPLESSQFAVSSPFAGSTRLLGCFWCLANLSVWSSLRLHRVQCTGDVHWRHCRYLDEWLYCSVKASV